VVEGREVDCESDLWSRAERWMMRGVLLFSGRVFELRVFF